MLNEVSCPEVEELMETFKTMTTVVKFANVSLESGNVEAAQQSYVEALVLFKKLQNSRGVSERLRFRFANKAGSWFCCVERLGFPVPCPTQRSDLSTTCTPGLPC